jgi:hypothetical protein
MNSNHSGFFWGFGKKSKMFVFSPDSSEILVGWGSAHKILADSGNNAS